MAHEKIVSIHWKNVSGCSPHVFTVEVVSLSLCFYECFFFIPDYRTMHLELRESSSTHQRRLQSGERRGESQF